MKQNNILMMIVVALVVGGAAFFGGMKYQQSKMQFGFVGQQGQFAQGQFAQRRGGGAIRFGGGAGGGIRPVVGQILSIDDTSLTIKLPDGSSKIVNISATTSISKTDTGAKSDLKTGSQIAAFGTTNSDGSVTAQNIQLNPMFQMGRRGQGGSPQPTP